MNRRIPALVLGGAAVLCIAALAVGAWALMRRAPSSQLEQWTPPQDLIPSQSIHPSAALLLLSAENENGALDDTLAQGDWMTAFGLIAYSPTLSDTSRVGNLLLIASRLASVRPPTFAARAYEYALFISTVSPSLNDLARAQTLLQTAAGLSGLGEPDLARLALDQAFLLAASSPAIPAIERVRLSQKVGDLYQQWQVTSLRDRARALEAEAARQNSVAAQLPAPLPPLPVAPLPEDKGLTAAIEARRNAAQALLNALPVGSQDLPAPSVQELASSLSAEDRARQPFYESRLKSAKDSPTRLALLRSRLEWIALKWRIAQKGLGFSLLPEWEKDRSAAEAALSEALNDLFQEEEAGVAQGPASVRDRALSLQLRRELELSRLGFDPGYDEAGLRQRLDEVNNLLVGRGEPGLFLDTLKRGSNTWYLLVPPDRYGQGENALPH